MPLVVRWTLFALAAWALALSSPASAGPSYGEFLQALRDRGYADVALEYLDWLQNNPKTPAELRELLDVERCNTYLIWARSSTDPKAVEQRVSQAQAYLKKFMEAHPHDPRIATPMALSADRVYQKAVPALIAARRAESAEQRKLKLEEARVSLEQAVKFLDAAAKYYTRWRDQLASQPQPESASARAVLNRQRERVELGAAEARFKAGLVYYRQAELLEPDDKDRKDLLRKAAAEFDAIYQELRQTTSQACLFAHLWHARTLQELGSMEEAEDIYEEVLAGAPTNDRGSSELAPLWAQAAHFQLLPKLHKGEVKAFVDEGTKWLRSHTNWRETSGYQGLALDVAKAQLKLAAEAKDAAAGKLREQAIASLANIAKVRTEFQDDAIFLHRQLLQKMGGSDAGVEELLILGDAAATEKQWAEAEKHYAKALQVAKDKKSAESIKAAEERIHSVRHAVALGLLSAGNYEEALQAAGQLARENPKSANSPRAALLAVSAGMVLYKKATEKDRPAALERLEKMAQFMTQTWPGRPEVDDAWLSIGQTRLGLGDLPGAMSSFAQVSPKSPRYAAVLYVLGQMKWREYLEEKKKEEGEQDAERMKTARAKAEEHLQGAVARLGTSLRADSSEAAGQLAEAQLLLANVLMEGKQYDKAVALLDPVVSRIKALKPKTIDGATFGIFVTAIRAHLGVNHIDPASETASVLLEIAGSEPRYNEVLVNLARLLSQEYKRADAIASGTSPADIKAQEEAHKKAGALRAVLIKILQRLLKREGFSLNDQIYLGECCDTVGMNDEAVVLFEGVLKKVQEDPAKGKDAGRLILRVRAQLLSLLRNQGKYEEAIKQCDELIRKHPRALDPKMVRARILEDWARKDATKYGPAVAQWTEIRVLLGRIQPRPNIYYETLYNTANCLFSQGQTTKDPEKLLQAEQLLKTTLTVNSKLNGADQVEQYRQLLKQISVAQQRLEKAAKNAPAPATPVKKKGK